ncbi:MAG: site-specific DNA-methyltransferase [Paludibacteraceae bacterium]|nr:site-specific DNA-methyltransferase [Paludibacteraceae bacterium]
MVNKNDFIKAGFTVVGTENNENKLLSFLKEHYPSVIKDNEIDVQELKAVAGLPVDEKVNGYGLSFVGRNFARAKYTQRTEKELSLNTALSKHIDTTQNLVLKGDNLDSLKILKSHYSGKIKCIYIDPPYNTANDEFIYPDKFDKEEAEVLGLQNLSDEDFARMDFSFTTRKSHNGWLSFMYPRLLLARDLLSKDGVIFISIDDNEQANLKLLCDDVFGEENFVANFIWKKTENIKMDSQFVSINKDYVICYKKSSAILDFNKEISDENRYKLKDNKGKYYLRKLDSLSSSYSKGMDYVIEYEGKKYYAGGSYEKYLERQKSGGARKDAIWLWSKSKFEKGLKEGEIVFKNGNVYNKIRFTGEAKKPFTDFIIADSGQSSQKDLNSLFDEQRIFDHPKPINLVEFLIKLVESNNNDIILDFFAGSGTTGHAVMQLNTEDGGNRKFILCQIDEAIKEDKPAYKFCVENNLPPVISSITIERLRRAGEKIAQNIEEENSKVGLFEEDKKQIPDIGFKVFDNVDAPKLNVDETGQISIAENEMDTLSRIYNMIFTVGLDEPTQVPEEVVKDCIYRIGNNYYITNSEKITGDDFANAIKNGKVFVDGWTASLNGTLQSYKEDVKIVFERYHMETS